MATLNHDEHDHETVGVLASLGEGSLGVMPRFVLHVAEVQDAARSAVFVVEPADGSAFETFTMDLEEAEGLVGAVLEGIRIAKRARAARVGRG